MKKGIALVSLFGIFMLVSLYGLMWVVSSSHLAHDYCKGNFALFHEEFRCRQPQLALILAGSSGLFSLVFLFFGIKRIRVLRANT